MKFGFIVSEYPYSKLTFGGIGTSVHDLARMMVESGHDVTVFIYGTDLDCLQWHNGVRLHFLKSFKLPYGSGIVNRLEIRKVVNKYIKEHLIDLVFVPDWTGISAFMKFNVPVVMICNGSDSYFCSLEGRKVKHKNKILEKKAFFSADHIIAVSDFVGVMTNRLFDSQRKFTVIPNAVDIDRFSFSDAFPVKKTILYTGTLVRKKGILELPAIFKLVQDEFSDMHFIIAGRDAKDVQTGSDSTWFLLKEEFDKLGIRNLKYVGPVDRSELPELLKSSSVCVYPSFAEALPLTWLEAMSCGRPVVGSSIGWGSEVITDGVDGLLCHPSDHQRFARLIIDLLQQPQKSSMMGSNARKKAERCFSSEIVLKKYLNFCRQIGLY